MTDPDDVRIGHVDRAAAADALVAHLSAGRLSPTEFEHRASAAAHARTRRDLACLFHDLPETRAAPPPDWGRLPEALREDLQAEGVVALVEDVPASITYRRYRAGPVHLRNHTAPVVAALAATRVRLLVWTSGTKHVDVPYNHPLWLALAITAENPTTLRIAYKAQSFHPARSGAVTLRLTTPDAPVLAAAAHRVPRPRGTPG